VLLREPSPGEILEPDDVTPKATDRADAR